MRIISGIARGRKLFTPGKSNTIRPTTDRAREALFSIIGHRVVSSRVLDLYAGTGALGLEALSRGAAQTVFVDKYRNSLNLIKRNYNLCVQDLSRDQKRNTIIIKHDLRRGVDLAFPEAIDNQKFDLIFLDPPYDKGLADACLEALNTSQLLTPGTLIVAEESSSKKLPNQFSRLTLSDKRRYGDTGFWFYTVTTPIPTQ